MDEMGLLGELRAGLPAPRAVARASARGQLIAQIEAAQRPRQRFFGWGNRRLRLLAAATAVVAAAAALVLVVFSGSGRVEPAAAQILREAAGTAAAQVPVAPGPNQFLYTRSKSAYLTMNPGWSVLVPSERETWISLDGSRLGRIRAVTGHPRFVSADQRAGWVAAGSPPLPRAGAVEETTVSGAGGIVDPADLPTDPAALLAKIEARSIPGVDGPPGEAETFTLIGDLLRQAYLPSAVRAALYEAAAELPGVESLGEVSDPIGRAGLGVAFSDRGTRHELVLDPETSALLGERATLLGTGAYGFDAAAGTTIGWAAYLESKVVDSVGTGAAAGAGAFDNSVGCYEEASLQGSVAILHGDDPIATCEEVWREGAIGPGGPSPQLVACTEDGTPAFVFPGAGPALCARLGLVPLDPDAAGWSR